MDEIRNKKLNAYQASEKYRIPRTTLIRHATSHPFRPGHPNLFSEEIENSFVHHLNMLAEGGFPFDLMDLRQLAKTRVEKKN